MSKKEWHLILRVQRELDLTDAERNYSYQNLPKSVSFVESIKKITTYQPVFQTTKANKTEYVKIGNQVWMTNNLDVDNFRNGDPIPEGKSDEEWQNAQQKGNPLWCYYNNDPEMGRLYGRLYNWFAVNDPRGLAPKGFHVPSDKEWKPLVEYAGGKEAAGNFLKSTSGWSGNGNGNDKFGFSCLPSGYRGHAFCAIFFVANFWSSTENKKKNSAFSYSLNYGTLDLQRGNGAAKSCGFSVRCLRD